MRSPFRPSIGPDSDTHSRLEDQIAAWSLLPTPVARDYKGGQMPESEAQLTQSRGEGGRSDLASVAMWIEKDNPLLPTPAAADGNGGGRLGSPGHATPLPGAVHDLLPTPSVADGTGGHRSRSGKRSDELLLPGVVASLPLLPTPRARDKGSPGDYSSADHRPTLTEAVGLAKPPLLPTPRATDGSKGSPNQHGSKGDLMLPSAVHQLLPTPVARDSGNTPEQHLAKKPGRKVVTSLAIVVDHGLLPTGGQLLPTPRASRGASGTETVAKLEPAGAAPVVWTQDRQLLDEVESEAEPLVLLPTPTAADARRRLPTPDRSMGNRGPQSRAALEAGERQVNLNDLPRLLPTPTVTDMGSNKTVEEWEEWTKVMKVRTGNGNGHGPSLAVEALRTLPTPTAQAAKHTTDDRGPGTLDDANLWSVVARPSTDWGNYAPAIRRWESVLGRPSPPPIKTSKRGAGALAPEFVEWMMGLPEGHVTDPAIAGKLTRNEQLKALGNGVVPVQAEAAIRHLLQMTASARGVDVGNLRE